MENTFNELRHAKITPCYFVFFFHCLGVILCLRIMQKMLIKLTKTFQQTLIKTLVSEV